MQLIVPVKILEILLNFMEIKKSMIFSGDKLTNIGNLHKNFSIKSRGTYQKNLVKFYFK